MTLWTVLFPMRFSRKISSVISGNRLFAFTNRYVGDTDAKLLEYVSKPIIAKSEPACTYLS